MVAEGTIDIRMQFVRKVYSILYVRLPLPWRTPERCIHRYFEYATDFVSPPQDRPDPPHYCSQLDFVLQRVIPNLDSRQLLAHDHLHLWRSWLHARNLLEAQVIPSKPAVPLWFHSDGGVLDQRCDLILRIPGCRAGPGPYIGHLCRAHALRMPN